MAAMAFTTRVVFGNRVVPPKELLAVVDGTGQAMFDASVCAKVRVSAPSGAPGAGRAVGGHRGDPGTAAIACEHPMPLSNRPA